jgi:chromosome partitioning protein
MSEKKRPTPVIAVLNMKGGVGKTTLAANLFREVHRKLPNPAKTLLIDFDAQFNLTQLLITVEAYEKARLSNRTIWGILQPDPAASVFATSANTAFDFNRFSEFTKILEKATHGTRELHLLPGDFRLATLNLREKESDLKIPRKLFSDLIAYGREHFQLVVVDCNPSSSFLTRTAIENATDLLVPVRPDKYSVIGLQMLDDYMRNILKLSAPPDLNVIMNASKGAPPGIESAIRADITFGKKVLQAGIPYSKILEARRDYTGFATDRRVRFVGRLQSALSIAADEIIKKTGLPT